VVEWGVIYQYYCNEVVQINCDPDRKGEIIIIIKIRILVTTHSVLVLIFLCILS
jgi:hypothetical protein